MRIQVENEKLKVDGTDMAIADLSQAFLDNVVSESLAGNVKYELKGEHPLVAFFQTLDDETKEGSSLRQKMDDVRAAREAATTEASEPEAKDDESECGNGSDE